MKKNIETDTHVYFYTNEFSNFHQCEIIYVTPLNHITFYSSEQLFMYLKAVYFDDPIAIEKLLNKVSPAEAKSIGRSVQNYDDSKWKSVRLNMMIEAVYHKFNNNNTYLKEKLLNTGNKIIVEASKTDLIWGVGLAASDPLILDENNWKGQNLLGKALMIVRKKLK